jgi:MFS superfamily sulfate permease-like transporter
VIDFDGLRDVWRISRVEFGFALIALMGALSFGVLQGVVVALIATFVFAILNAMAPRVVLMGRLPGRMGFYKLHRTPDARPLDGLTICFIQGGVLFFNADNVKDRLEEIITQQPTGTRWLLIDASAISQIDSTAAAMFQGIRSELNARGIRLAFAELQSDVAALLARAGLLGANGEMLIFEDLEDSVQAFSAAHPELQPSVDGQPLAGLATETMEE